MCNWCAGDTSARLCCCFQPPVRPLIDAGRIKVYSTDSVAGKAWFSGQHSAEYCSKLQNAFDAMIYHEITPAIRADCKASDIEIITAGASIGAFNAVAVILTHSEWPLR